MNNDSVSVADAGVQPSLAEARAAYDMAVGLFLSLDIQYEDALVAQAAAQESVTKLLIERNKADAERYRAERALAAALRASGRETVPA